MKKAFLIIIAIGISSMAINIQAETNPAEKKTSKDGEEIFLANADKCLDMIAEAAKEIPITGSTMVAYIPGEETTSWISKMKVVGNLANDKSNYLGIIYAKAAEMAVTHKNSGNGERSKIAGEVGWQGGVIIKVTEGYLVAAFSGGTGEQDAAVSKIGLDWLAEKYK